MSAPPDWEPCSLGRNGEGNADTFLKRNHGYGYNDMIALPTLTKDSLLENLARRYKYEVVYTYVGDIVVSVNPFKNVGNTGKAIRNKYKGGSRTALPPHIYARVPRRGQSGGTRCKSGAHTRRGLGIQQRRCAMGRAWLPRNRPVTQPRRVAAGAGGPRLQRDGAERKVTVDSHLGRVGRRQDRGDEDCPLVHRRGARAPQTATSSHGPAAQAALPTCLALRRQVSAKKGQRVSDEARRAASCLDRGPVVGQGRRHPQRERTRGRALHERHRLRRG